MPSHKVYEDEHVLAFLDIRPVNPGHTLVIPKAHSADMREMSDEDLGRVMAAARKIAPVILKTVGAESFNFTSNVGRAAGQIVFHTHFHIMPRFATDGYKPWERDDDTHVDTAELAKTIRNAILS